MAAICNDAHVKARRLILVLVLLAIVASGAAVATGSSHPIPRTLFVAISGHGKVTSVPHGISCPGVCRAFFPKDSLVTLVARSATGWRFGGWRGDLCSGAAVSVCTFNLTSTHDCSGSLCKVGAFGIRVNFVTAHPSGPRPATPSFR
jgi:hypothetical protein